MAERETTSERDDVENEPSAYELSVKFSQLGVENVFIDWDGTLGDTSAVFKPARDEICKMIDPSASEEKLAEMERTWVYENFSKLNTIYGVHPEITETNAFMIMHQFGEYSAETWDKIVERIRQMYDEDIYLAFEGAYEQAGKIKRAFWSLNVATIAKPEWAKRKLETAGFANFFDEEICFDVRRSKHSQWKEILAERNANPSTIVMIGDNYNSDLKWIIEEGHGRGILITNGWADNTLNEPMQKAIDEGRLVLINDIKEASTGIMKLK